MPRTGVTVFVGSPAKTTDTYRLALYSQKLFGGAIKKTFFLWDIGPKCGWVGWLSPKSPQNPSKSHFLTRISPFVVSKLTKGEWVQTFWTNGGSPNVKLFSVV